MTTWTLITGASEGLGVEFARIAAKNGRNVILTARSRDKLARVAEEIRGYGQEVVVVLADLGNREDVDRMWAEATVGRQIDTLINNAGLGRNGAFAEGDNGDWERELSSINVNMIAMTRLMKLAIAHMKPEGKGRILNVASAAAFMPGPNMAVYHATKAYALALSEAVAHELRDTKITITALCPGATATNFFNDADMGGVRLLNLAPPADAHQVALAGWRAAKAGQRVVVPGVMNKVFAFLPRLAPRSLVTTIAAFFLGKRQG